jgi:FkbM family methyltransferase
MMYKKGFQCQVPHLSELFVERFGYITDGSFVEIGAFDGYTWSNTWGLAEAGWKGLMVEPQPEFFDKCVERHGQNPRINLECCCIGSEDKDEVKLFLGKSISTTVLERVELYAEFDWSSYLGMKEEEFIVCPMMTLDTLLEKHHWKEGFEVLVVDVEGAEPAVLSGFDLELWKPRMVIIELHEEYPDERLSANAGSVGRLFARCGYEKLYADQINTIFWRPS